LIFLFWIASSLSPRNDGKNCHCELTKSARQSILLTIKRRYYKKQFFFLIHDCGLLTALQTSKRMTGLAEKNGFVFLFWIASSLAPRNDGRGENCCVSHIAAHKIKRILPCRKAVRDNGK
jgi:hypothetical protein